MEGSERPGKVKADMKRKANHPLTEQIVAAEHFAQVMRHHRPEAEAQHLATIVAGSTDVKVKAETSAKVGSGRWCWTS